MVLLINKVQVVMVMYECSIRQFETLVLNTQRTVGIDYYKKIDYKSQIVLLKFKIVGKMSMLMR